MRPYIAIAVLIGAVVSAACSQPPPAASKPLVDLQREVRAREEAFAKTMADRDHGAFVSFLADETIWFGARTLRGKQDVGNAWKKFYEGPVAPFSWKPDTVEVLASGRLALTSGPVSDPEGKPSGRFNSIWRLDDDGVWRVVFDKGEDE